MLTRDHSGPTFGDYDYAMDDYGHYLNSESKERSNERKPRESREKSIERTPQQSTHRARDRPKKVKDYCTIKILADFSIVILRILSTKKFSYNYLSLAKSFNLRGWL